MISNSLSNNQPEKQLTLWKNEPIRKTALNFWEMDNMETEPYILSQKRNSIDSQEKSSHPPSILFREKDSIDSQERNSQPPSILSKKKNSMETRDYGTGTITSYKKGDQYYYRFSYYKEKKKKHLHLGNVENPRAIAMVREIKRKQKDKTPLPEIIKFIAGNKL